MFTEEGQAVISYRTEQGKVLPMITARLVVYLTISAALLSLTGQAQDSLSTGLVAYYPFNGNVKDESGKGNNGAINGSPQIEIDRFNRSASAYRLNGKTDWISAAGSSTLNITGEMTISVWVKPRIAGNNRDLVLLSYSKRNADNDQYAFGLNYQNRLFFTYYNQVWHDTIDPNNTSWVDNQWQHASVVIRKSQNRVELYKNGKLLSSSVGVFSTQPMVSVAGAELHIGMNTGENYCFPGSLDDVRVYNRALSASEVALLYTSESTLIDSFITIGLYATTVRVVMQVNMGRQYQLQSSPDLKTWSYVGTTFWASSSSWSQEFEVLESGQYFRLQELP
jgi:trimeric autotransporter adhesin